MDKFKERTPVSTFDDVRFNPETCKVEELGEDGKFHNVTLASHFEALGNSSYKITSDYIKKTLEVYPLED